MIFDKENCFSWKQSLAQVAGTYRSEQTLDLGTPGAIYLPPLKGTNPTAEIDIGKGEPVEVLIWVNETFTSGGAATVQAILSVGTAVTAGDISAGEVTLFDSGAIGYATLVAGYHFKIRTFWPGIKLRYMQLRYVIAAAATTAGKITAGIVDQRQTNMIGL